MFSRENWRIFKITCFEKHLRTAASIRCYLDAINLKQSGFCTTCSFKVLVLEQKYKNNLKNRASQKNIFYNSHICVYVMSYYEIPWFYQDFKSENLFFKSVPSSRYENTGPITRDHFKSFKFSFPKWETKHLYNTKGFSFIPEQV